MCCVSLTWASPQATLGQIEYLEQVEAQLQMLQPKEPGADEVLRGMQVLGYFLRLLLALLHVPVLHIQA